MKPTALITGGTGGLGLATTRFLVSRGWQVFVADCNEQAIKALAEEKGIIPVMMDVTSTSSVEAAFHLIRQQVEKLDAIVNFAGILRVGSMAEMPEQTLKLLLDINVMGTFRVNQAFLPLLQSGARIVNISSETGWQSGGPFNGAYAMSKHAIEAYSDSLRRELCFLGIAVIKIQPGPFKTEMVGSIEQNFSRAIADTKHFSKQLTRIKALAMNEQNKAHDPAILASAVYKALTVKKPKPAYSVKADPARSFLEWFPTAWADGLLKKVLG